MHNKVIHETLKRSEKVIKKRNLKVKRKKSETKKFEILKQVSEVAEKQKKSEEERPEHWEDIESNLTFEIVVRRIQRRFRFKRGLRNSRNQFRSQNKSFRNSRQSSDSEYDVGLDDEKSPDLKTGDSLLDLDVFAARDAISGRSDV